MLRLENDTLLFGAVGAGDSAKTHNTIALRAGFQVPAAMFSVGLGFYWTVTVQP